MHHGNGTQALFEDDPRVLYVSLHRFPFYPNTGHHQECGRGAGKGYTVNVGWPEGGVGDAEYLAAFRQLILPIARSFDPQFVIISAGFDAAAGDPLGGCDLSPAGYAHMTAELLTLRGGKARCLLVLEGGYNLTSIARSAEACVRVLLGEPPLPLPPDHDPSYLLESADNAIMRTAAVHVRFWPALRQVWGSSLDPYLASIDLAQREDAARADADAAREAAALRRQEEHRELLRAQLAHQQAQLELARQQRALRHQAQAQAQQAETPGDGGDGARPPHRTMADDES